MSEKHEARRAGIVARLYAALDQKMREIEDRIAARAGTDGASAADSERDARTLTALARLFEKLTALEANPGAGAKPSGPGKEQDAERFRREIADRLERTLKSGKD